MLGNKYNFALILIEDFTVHIRHFPRWRKYNREVEALNTQGSPFYQAICIHCNIVFKTQKKNVLSIPASKKQKKMPGWSKVSLKDLVPEHYKYSGQNGD